MQDFNWFFRPVSYIISNTHCFVQGFGLHLVSKSFNARRPTSLNKLSNEYTEQLNQYEDKSNIRQYNVTIAYQDPDIRNIRMW